MMKQVTRLADERMRDWDLRRQSEIEEKRAKAPVVCLSRDLGCGGRTLCKRLADRLGCEIVGRDTIDAIAGDLGAQRRMVDSLDERSRETLQRWIDGYLHGTPVEYDEYARSLVKVVRARAIQGGVVFLGRGCGFILGLDRAFCVRVVAPMERRISQIMAYEGLSADRAEELISKTDQERARFTKRVLHRDINDPLGYHLTINLADFEFDTIEEIVLDTMRREGFFDPAKIA